MYPHRHHKRIQRWRRARARFLDKLDRWEEREMHGRHRHRRRRARGGFGARRLFGPGDIRLALLSLLGEGRKHGYQLMKELEERSGGVYRASAGSIYPTLSQLEDEGLARSQNEQGKRVYELTDAGRELLDVEDDAIERIWRRARQWEDWSGFGAFADPEAAEVMRPVLRLARAAHKALRRTDGDPDRIEEVRELLDQVRRRLDELGRGERD